MEITEILTSKDLAEFVKERSEKHWADTHQALLLTTLGTQALALMNDKTLMRKLGGLKSFIDKNVETLRVIPHTSAAGKHGVVPAAADVPENTDFLFSSGAGSPATHQSATHRSYYPGFWKAFKNPPIPGHARIWSADAPLTYFDLPMGQNIPEHAFEIPERFILGIEGSLGSVNAATLRENIKRYISERELDEDTFVYKPTREGSRISSHTESNESILNFSQALTKLSKADQARIMVPLDIVIELFRFR